MQAGRHAQRLLVWQLSDQLRLEIGKVTKTLDADPRLRTAIEDEASAICRNIAEALTADHDRDFARFVRLARASVADLHDRFRIALVKRHLTETDLRSARELLGRLYPSLSSLLSQCHTGLRYSQGPVRRRA